MKKARMLGLLCPTILILAMAIGATQASASRLASPEASGGATTYLKATPTGSHSFSANGPGSFSCSTPSGFSTSMSTQATSQFSSGSLSDYGCVLFGGSTTMKMNGCSFTFHPGAETSPGVFGGTFDIGPTGCGPITMKYLGGGCEISFYPKTGLAAEFVNKGAGNTATVEVKVAASGLKYTENAGCGKGGENGTYSGGWVLKGSTNPSGTIQTGISVTTKAALYLSGEPTKFTGEAYPETVKGTATTAQVFTLPQAGSISCKKGTFGGTLAGASSQLSLAPSYSECVALSTNAVVKAGLCSIVLNATGAGTGTASIACPEGESITVEPKSFGLTVCTVSFPSQSLGSVTYESVGTGIDRHVVASISGSKIQYTSTGGICGPSASDASFSGGIELQGQL